MSKSYVKEKNKRGQWEIFEGEVKPGNVFSISRYICQVGEQETEKKTEELAEFIINQLSKTN